MFQRASIYTASGRFICDQDNIPFKTAIQLPLITPLNKLMNNPPTSSGAVTPAEPWTGLSVTNALTTAVTAEVYAAHADAVATKKNYTEKKELVGGGSATATPVVLYQFSLNIFGDLFADPRILAFNEQIFIKFQMAPVSGIYYNVTALSSAVTGASAGTSMALTGILLQLAVVQDKMIADKILSAIAGPTGLSLLVDYTNSLKLATSGTAQAFSNTITRAYGTRLKSVLWSIFASGGAANTVYVRNNISDAIITQAQTYLNSVPKNWVSICQIIC